MVLSSLKATRTLLNMFMIGTTKPVKLYKKTGVLRNLMILTMLATVFSVDLKNTI